MNFELISFANADELASRVAGLWLDEIESANRAGKIYCVALSGGRVTQKFFNETVKQAKTRNISFARVHFFWADERCVPPTDADSNFKLANELLFAPLKIAENQIHRLRGEISPAEAVKIANEEIRRIVAISSPSPQQGESSLPSLDLVFLGMGEDGHVASLFPGKTEGMNPKEIFCAVENSPKPPPNRLSLSYAAIAVAKNVWVLVSATGKETALRESLDHSGKTPLAKVIQSRLATKIFTDTHL
ncbi:MAG TPA: 6-phosphogluconolactonase [Verrucomicrobiae bacterium]|nr:6-phosphogluconolactonase [Verrucomicrobiae bacterium]